MFFRASRKFLSLTFFTAFAGFTQYTEASTACLNEVTNGERICYLSIRSETVSKAGFKNEHAMTINGQIPAPRLEFNVGETAVIHVTNNSDEITSLHWHGILLPWNMDGPMFSNNKPIAPGETFTFRFRIKHKGTYWYHSHTGLQEQRGLYGPIVIKGGHEHHNVDHEEVLVLSDWSTESPKQILANIKSDGHYYEFKKDSQTSWLGAIRHGAVWDYVKGQWTRMGTMDLSDVGYDAFLINGEQNRAIHKHFMPGQRVKLRVINAGASSYFYLNIGHNRMFHVVAKDGVDVEPVMVSEILMGMGETYDVVFTIPEHGAYEVRATAQDVTGHASLILGHGEYEAVPNKMKPNPYKMEHGDHDGAGDHGGGHGDGHGGGGHNDGGHGEHGNMQMAQEDDPTHPPHDPGHPPGDDMPMTKRLNYSMLKATEHTAYPSSHPRHKIHLELDGDMERYLWTINGKTFTEETYIEVNEGDVVQFTMVNKTMMHHPMHLHGHFFRLLNGQGHKAPLLHTVDVGPMATQTIEFLANEPGIWFFHCHNLYHMKMGMARLIKYRGFERGKELQESEAFYSRYLGNDKTGYLSGELGVFTNRAEIEAKINQGRYEVELELEIDDYDPDRFEADLVFKRYLSRYFAVIGGAEYDDKEMAAILGIQWELPLKVEMTAYTNSRGHAVIKLSKEFNLTKRVSFIPAGKFRFNTDEGTEFEAEAKLMYKINERISAGLLYNYSEYEGADDHTVGVGFTIQLGSKELLPSMPRNSSTRERKRFRPFGFLKRKR